MPFVTLDPTRSITPSSAWKKREDFALSSRKTSTACIVSPAPARHRLVELHGTNALVECQTCHWRGDPEPHFEYFRLNRRPPLCQCGGFLKPATISFGQNLDPKELERAGQAAMESDLVVSLGSTLSVYPAASFPLIAAQRGAPYIVINRGATDHDHEQSVTLRLEGEVGEIFPPAVEVALA